MLRPKRLRKVETTRVAATLDHHSVRRVLDGPSTLSVNARSVEDEAAEDRSQTNEVQERSVTPIVKTAAALLSVQGVTWAASLVGILVVPRLLGSAQLGLYGSLAALVAVASRIAAMGTSTLVARDVAQDPSGAQKLGWHASLGRLLIMAATALLFITGGVLLRLDLWVVAVLIVMTVGATAVAVGDVALSALQGNHTLGRAAAWSSCVQLAGTLAAVLVLFLGAGLLGLVAAATVTAIVAAAVALGFFVKRFGWNWDWSAHDLRALAERGSPFLAWDLGLLLYGNIDFVILPALADSRTAGNYVFAYRLASIPAFFATIVVGSVFPTLAKAVADPDWFARVLTRAVVVTLGGTLPMAVGLAILAPWLTRTLGGSAEFSAAPPLIVILSVHIPLAAVDTILGTAVLARNRQRTLAGVAWIAAICNPAANIVLIPITVEVWGNGAIGAAIVTVATELAMAAVLWRLTRTWLVLPELRSGAFRICAATIVMVVVVLMALTVVAPPGVIGLGALVYLGAALLVRVASPSDLRVLRSSLSGRPASDGDARSTARRPGDASVMP